MRRVSCILPPITVLRLQRVHILCFRRGRLPHCATVISGLAAVIVGCHGGITVYATTLGRSLAPFGDGGWKMKTDGKFPAGSSPYETSMSIHFCPNVRYPSPRMLLRAAGRPHGRCRSSPVAFDAIALVFGDSSAAAGFANPISPAGPRCLSTMTCLFKIAAPPRQPPRHLARLPDGHIVRVFVSPFTASPHLRGPPACRS